MGSFFRCCVILCVSHNKSAPCPCPTPRTPYHARAISFSLLAVSRSTPKVVTLTHTQGSPDNKWDVLPLKRFDRVEIAGQRRTILWLQDAEDFENLQVVTLRVDYDFVDSGVAHMPDGTSYGNVIDPMTPVVKLSLPVRSDGVSLPGETVRCLITDIRPVSDESTACHDSGRPNCGHASVGGTDPQNLNCVVTFRGPLSDPSEIIIGDRIRIVTSGTVVPGGEGEGVAPRWETRTVDSVIYEIGTSPNIGVPARKEDTFGEKRIVGVTVSFGFTSAWQDKPAFIDTAGTTEMIECSGRGLCDQTVGECRCFTGYTWDDCSQQEALAL